MPDVHGKLIQDCHDQRSIQEEEHCLHQQIGHKLI